MSNAQDRRLAKFVLGVSAVGLALSAAGCSSSSAPKTATPQPTATATSTAPPTTTTTASQTAGSSTTSQQPSTDAAGAAISSTLTVTPDSKKPAASKSGAPSDATVIAHAKDLLAVDQDANVSSASVTSRTKDSQGHWWFLLSVNVVNLGDQKAVITFDGKSWDDPVFGSLINNDDLPKDVRF